MTSDNLVQLADILRAQQVIGDRLYHTPMLLSSALGKMTGTTLRFKAEMFQKTGSFKPRGAINKLNSLSAEEKARGVISISAGNHAAGLAYAASLLGVKATIVMPENAVQSKIDATRSYGGEVILHGSHHELLPRMQEIQRERNLTFVHPFDDPLIIAGQGTVGLEIAGNAPDVDIAVVGVGGGGLISGVAAALKAKIPSIKIIGVEPEGAQAMTQSLRDGKPAHPEHISTIADGLAAPFAGEHTLAHVQALVDEVVLVSDDEIAEALRLILERSKVLAEPAAAASFAALLFRKFSFPTGARVVCVLSGGNIDRSRLKSIL